MPISIPSTVISFSTPTVIKPEGKKNKFLLFLFLKYLFHLVHPIEEIPNVTATINGKSTKKHDHESSPESSTVNAHRRHHHRKKRSSTRSRYINFKSLNFNSYLMSI